MIDRNFCHTLYIPQADSMLGLMKLNQNYIFFKPTLYSCIYFTQIENCPMIDQRIYSENNRYWNLKNSFRWQRKNRPKYNDGIILK